MTRERVTTRHANERCWVIEGIFKNDKFTLRALDLASLRIGEGVQDIQPVAQDILI